MAKAGESQGGRGSVPGATGCHLGAPFQAAGATLALAATPQAGCKRPIGRVQIHRRQAATVLRIAGGRPVSSKTLHPFRCRIIVSNFLEKPTRSNGIC
jgi:hypothetical protein